MVKNIANNFVEKISEESTDNSNAAISEPDDDSDMDHENTVEGPSTSQEGRDKHEVDRKSRKKRKKGIIYISNIPKHMNVTRIREILSQYGEIGRVYLQFEKKPESENGKKSKRKPYARHFTEGWVEFQRKRVAKQVAEMLNTKQISTRKRSHFYDCLWSMKYLPRFKWIHLSERLIYEKAVHKQRLMTEVSQARKEAAFFQNNLDKSEMLKKKTKHSRNKET